MIYSVSRITVQLKTLIENSFSDVTVEGEISNCRPSSTGHIYFTLKEQAGGKEYSLSAVMFKYAQGNLKFKPEDGLKVQVTGNISLYEKSGTYQIIAARIELAGEGEILRLLEERKRKLQAEGLFDRPKKALPAFVTDIAVITSPTGAAVRDIIKIAKKRNPKIKITVLPASVQGADAPASLIRQLQNANRYRLGQIIIIGRGGGSLDDLLPFSDEELAREIARSELPIISAVGHQIDFSISDFVADVRAATPSEASEIAVPLLSEQILDIQRYRENIVTALQFRLAETKKLIAGFSKKNLLTNVQKLTQPFLLRLDESKTKLEHAMQNNMLNTKHRIELCTQRLQLSNPKAILQRGFSVVRTPDGGIVRDSRQVAPADRLVVTPAVGTFEVTVTSKDKPDAQ